MANQMVDLEAAETAALYHAEELAVALARLSVDRRVQVLEQLRQDLVELSDKPHATYREAQQDLRQ